MAFSCPVSSAVSSSLQSSTLSTTTLNAKHSQEYSTPVIMYDINISFISLQLVLLSFVELLQDCLVYAHDRYRMISLLGNCLVLIMGCIIIIMQRGIGMWMWKGGPKSRRISSSAGKGRSDCF